MKLFMTLLFNKDHKCISSGSSLSFLIYQSISLVQYQNMKVSVRVRDRNILNYKVSIRYQSVKVSVRNVSVRFYLQPY